MSVKLGTTKSPFLVILLFFVLLLIQAAPFLTGYRLTADDVVFHYVLMSGWSDSWTFIKDTSIAQGRIVHLIDLPFSLLGSYYADRYIFRVFYTGIYFSNFILIGLYVSLILLNRFSRHVVLLIAVVLISFHPLDYFHLAPTAYPFHISLPVFLILFSRIRLWVLRVDGQLKFSAREAGWLFLCFVGMMFSEYGFLFGISLMFSEALIRAVRVAFGKDVFWGGIFKSFWHPWVFRDIVLTALFLALYFGFRVFFPSSYDGNAIASNLNIALFFKTLFGHIYGGTSIASFVRYKPLTFNGLSGLGFVSWIYIIFVFLGTFFVSIVCISSVICKDKTELPIHKNLLIALLGVFSALVMTTPIAMTGKYQSWCVDINSCIFLDSRISFMGIGLFIFALMVIVINVAYRLHVGLLLTIAVSITIAVVASISYLNNEHIAMDMKNYVLAWDRAKKLACVPESMLQKVKVSSVVDPNRRVSYSPGFDVDNYWLKYLDDQRQIRRCEYHPQILSDLYPEVLVGQPMLAEISGRALPYLQSGWSAPEPWGTWSDSKVAHVYLPITANIREIVVEAKAFVTSVHPKQDIVIRVNGLEAIDISIGQADENLIKIVISKEMRQTFIKEGLIRLEFTMPNAVSPLELGLSGDARKLSIGLISILVR
jgi:hypothetical protein